MADSGITFDANYQIRVLDADKFTATETLQAQAGEFVGKVTEFDNSEGAASRARAHAVAEAGWAQRRRACALASDPALPGTRVVRHMPVIAV